MAEHTQLGYLGTDQYGHYYTIKKHPRKELMEQLGSSHVDKIYVDTTDGKVRHIGYVIAGHWVRVFRVCQWKEAH